MRNNIFTIHLWLYEALKGIKVVATWSVSHKTHKVCWEIENFSRFRLPPPLWWQIKINIILITFSRSVFVKLSLISKVLFMEYLVTHSCLTKKIRDKYIFSQWKSSLFMRKLFRVYTFGWVWLWGMNEISYSLFSSVVISSKKKK